MMQQMLHFLCLNQRICEQFMKMAGNGNGRLTKQSWQCYDKKDFLISSKKLHEVRRNKDESD